MPQRIITVILLIGLLFGLITLVSGMSSWRLPDNQQGYAPKQPIDYSHRLHAGELGIGCHFCHSGSQFSRHAGIPASDVCMKCHKHVTSSFEALQAELKRQDEEEEKRRKEKEAKEKKDPEEAQKTKEERKPNEEQEPSEVKLPKRIISERLAEFYKLVGVDDPSAWKPGDRLKSIPWVRVHNLPDYVYFDHRAHVAVGVKCQRCHGEVESMQRMQQTATLSMGWCVSCHREATRNGINKKAVHASTDCSVCHY